MPEPSARSEATVGAASAAAERCAVRLRGLIVAYGTHVALQGVELDLPAGRLTAVIGPNGSGKSTLLAVISGLLRPTAGEVGVASPDPRRPPRVAHVLQSTVVNESVPLTVREVVAMGRYATRGTLRRLAPADRVAIDAALERMRIGDVAARQLRELSGGLRQRVLVAQGLAQDADVLLLDEPITGLDLPTQEVISEVVTGEAARGVAVVVTTHDVGTAAHADHVVLMATAVVASGAAPAVLTAENLDRAYGGHIHVLADGTVLIDDPHMHHEAHRSPVRLQLPRRDA